MVIFRPGGHRALAVKLLFIFSLFFVGDGLMGKSYTLKPPIDEKTTFYAKGDPYSFKKGKHARVVVGAKKFKRDQKFDNHLAVFVSVSNVTENIIDFGPHNVSVFCDVPGVGRQYLRVTTPEGFERKKKKQQMIQALAVGFANGIEQGYAPKYDKEIIKNRHTNEARKQQLLNQQITNQGKTSLLYRESVFPGSSSAGLVLFNNKSQKRKGVQRYMVEINIREESYVFEFRDYGG